MAVVAVGRVSGRVRTSKRIDFVFQENHRKYRTNVVYASKRNGVAHGSLNHGRISCRQTLSRTEVRTPEQILIIALYRVSRNGGTYQSDNPYPGTF